MDTTQIQHIVYVFLDAFNNELYVGRTSNPWSRMRGHISGKGLLAPSCYADIDRIFIAPCATHIASRVLERKLIKEWLPVYNKQILTGDIFNGCYVSADDLPVEWHEWHTEEWKPVRGRPAKGKPARKHYGRSGQRRLEAVAMWQQGYATKKLQGRSLEGKTLH